MPLGKAFVDWHRQAVEAQDVPEREGLEGDLEDAVAEMEPPEVPPK